MSEAGVIYGMIDYFSLVTQDTSTQCATQHRRETENRFDIILDLSNTVALLISQLILKVVIVSHGNGVT